MYRGTTPTYMFTLPDEVDLTIANKIFATFSRMDDTEILTKTDEDLEVTTHSVGVYLTQEETLAFPNGVLKFQLNWLYDSDGVTKRACTNIINITAQKNLKDEVLTNE